MRRLIVLPGLIALALATGAHAGTLNKCIDAKGRVTYSNLPCTNAREARTVEVDPAPTPEQPPGPQAGQPPAPGPAPRPAPAVIHLEKQRTTGAAASRSASRQCDALTDKLGRLFDRMDEARRKGYTQQQMDAWGREAKELERKKANAGCF